jgi:peptide/nickel transport system substrate-binding protein
MMRAPATRLAWATPAILALLLTGCSSPDTEDELVYGLTLAPSGIDPHLNASSELGIPLSSVYDTLVFQDPETGEFVPGLAESWDISEDGRTYTFHLRDDVRFHDGAPFNADAVVANFNYVLNPDHHSQKASFMLGPIEAVDAQGDDTVILRLAQPFAPLLDSLAQVYLGMASPAALEKWGPGEYGLHQVGSGPYRFIEYIPNDRLLLEKNADYNVTPPIYRKPEAQVASIRFRFYEDPATRALALQSGEVDIMGEIPPHEASRLEETGDFTIYPVPIPGQPLQLLFNTRRTPTDDVRVRRALVMAVDRARVVETVFGKLSPVAQGPLSAVTPGGPSGITYSEYDIAGAAELLDEAGWMLREDGARSKGDARLELLMVVPTWGSNPEVAQLVKVAWESIGATVELTVAPGFGPLKEAQSAGEYNAIGINLFGRDPDLLRPFFSSQGLYNWTGVADVEADRLLEEAAEEFRDEAARSDQYERLAEWIRSEALILPVRDYVNLVVAANRVSGLRFSSQGWFPFLIDLSLH